MYYKYAKMHERFIPAHVGSLFPVICTPTWWRQGGTHDCWVSTVILYPMETIFGVVFWFGFVFLKTIVSPTQLHLSNPRIRSPQPRSSKSSSQNLPHWRGSHSNNTVPQKADRSLCYEPSVPTLRSLATVNYSIKKVGFVEELND